MNSSLLAIARRTCCLLLFMAVANQVQSQKLDTAALYRISNVNYPDKSLALSYDGTNNLPVLRTTADQPTQHWKLKLSKSGNYRFVNIRQGNAYSLEVVNDADKNKLMLGATKDLASQAWRISTKPSGAYRITCLWLGTDKALAAVESTEANNAISMAPTNDADKTQEWRFIKLPPPTPMAVVAPTPQPQIPEKLGPGIDTSAVYTLSTQWLGETRVLGATGNAKRPELQEKKELAAQRWKFALQPNGYYRIVNSEYPSSCLDIINDGKNNNQVTLAGMQNYSGQFWKITSLADGAFVRFTSLWHGENYSIDVLNNGENKELVMNTTANYSGQWWKLTKTTLLPPPPPSPIVEVPKNKSTLRAGEELQIGMELKSPNGKYTLRQVEDGNLAIYNERKEAVWSSGIAGESEIEKCVMQEDGNLVQYNTSMEPIWSSLTGDNPGAYLAVLNDGNAVIYSKTDKVIWSTYTQKPIVVNAVRKSTLTAGEELKPGMEITSPNGKYTFIQQKDGNLVLYNESKQALWASGTNGRNVETCILQPDGNLVQYLPYKVAAWAAGTHGNAGAYLAVQDDGNVVIYSKSKAVLWATNTQR